MPDIGRFFDGWVRNTNNKTIKPSVNIELLPLICSSFSSRHTGLDPVYTHPEKWGQIYCAAGQGRVVQRV